MNRRTALKRFAISGAAAIILPGCVRDSKKVSVALNNLMITADEEELMGAIAEALIPATDKPGAKEVGAHLFALVMVDDCVSPEKKEIFLTGLRSFNQNAPVPSKKKFLDASREERTETLKNIEVDAAPGGVVKEFYFVVRHFIIQGYTTSQYFMTEVKPHKLVPGPTYKGCVPVPENLQS